MPRHTAMQLLDWVYRKHVPDPRRMSNIAAGHQQVIGERLPILEGELWRDQKATDGTRKLLIGWPEKKRSLQIAGAGPSTETVLIPASNRRTGCISSQVGCPVKCRFCASGLGGLEHNLSRGRIVEQAWRLSALGEGRLSNIVFMGMGEPLSNYAAVTDAIRTINADWGLGIGARRITVSTVGLPEAIRRLSTFEIPVTLALSLHAPNDDIRRQLIPWAEYATMSELIDAFGHYFQATGREVTLEYLLLGEVNDRPEHAKQLAEVANAIRCNINLIRYNEVDGLDFKRPQDRDVLAFQQTLRKHRLNVHIRASRGRDIAAACGQLRRDHAQQNEVEVTPPGEPS